MLSRYQGRRIDDQRCLLSTAVERHSPVTDNKENIDLCGKLIYNYGIIFTFYVTLFFTTVRPLTSTWPYLRCDVGLEEGEYY